MTTPIAEPGRVDEPDRGEDYANVLTRVAAEHTPIIVRRGGEDFAAVVPLEYFEMLQDLYLRREAQRIASGLDWEQLVKKSPPSPEWFERDEPKPF